MFNCTTHKFVEMADLTLFRALVGSSIAGLWVSQIGASIELKKYPPPAKLYTLCVCNYKPAKKLGTFMLVHKNKKVF